MARQEKDIFVIIEYKYFRCASHFKGLISLWRTLGRRELGLVAEGFPVRCSVLPQGLGKCSVPVPLPLSAQVNIHGRNDLGRVKMWEGAHTALNEAAAGPAHDGGRQVCRTISEKDGTKTPLSSLPLSYILEKPLISLSSKDSETHGWMNLIPLAQSTTVHVNWC